MRISARRASLLALLLLTACASILERARTAKGRGDLDQAESLYREALDDPEHASAARRELADIEVDRARDLEKDDPPGAEATYRRALEIEPAHDQALTGLVRMLRRAGRVDEAAAALDTAAASGACAACARLGVVVLLERGDRAMAAEQWDTAIARYGEAMKLRRQPAPALAIVRAHLAAGRGEQATDALTEVVALMAEADESITGSFFEVRSALVTAALAKDDTPLADRVRAIVLANEPASGAAAMELLVADHVNGKGDLDQAATRYTAVLGRGDALTPAQKSDVTARLVELHGTRATTHLAGGKAAEAEAELDRALELDPDDWELKLQRILAISPKTGAGPALEALTRVPASTAGIPQVKAILESQLAGELLDAGDIEGARAAQERAEHIHPDMPEVHLAAAQLLARTAPEDLADRDVRALGRGGLVDYDGEVVRYAEALGELDWARAANKSRAADYPFRAPWFGGSADALETRVREVYPHAVEFSPDPEPQLHFHNERDAALAVELDGPDGFEDALEIEPGHTAKVTLPDSGLLRLRIGGKKRTFYAEPYASVTLDL